MRRLEGLTMEELRELADSLKQKLGSGVVILGAEADGKAMLVGGDEGSDRPDPCRQDHSRDHPDIDGGGGGRPDFAQAGGKEAGRLDQALRRPFGRRENDLKITPRGDCHDDGILAEWSQIRRR